MQSFDLFAETRARFGEPPRRGPAIDRASTIKGPRWLRHDHPLHRVESERARVLEQGRLVRSWLVMANTLLFAPGPTAHPGNVVYAPDDDVDLETLSEIAGEIFRRRTAKTVDPELSAFAAAMSDSAHPSGRPVPAPIAHGRTLRVTAVLFHREALPRPYLGGHFFPLVVQEARRAAVVLPSWLWGADLRSAWVDAGAR